VTCTAAMRMAMATLAAVVLSGCAGSKSDATDTAVAVPVVKGATSNLAASDGDPTVLFLGTSLTAGLGLDPDSAYPQRIGRRIQAAGLRYQVVNAGVSGETSAGLLRRLDWVLRQPARVIVVETGANDGLRGQSVAATKATIGQVLDRIHRERPEGTILLAQMEAPTNLGQSYTTAFHAMFPEVARAKGVTLLPFLLDGVAGHPSLNQADGVHPNDVGELIVTDNVWRGLEPVLRAIGR
jgi:acyl-CoA thioesterase-1